jgi:hypothetical protein
MSISLVTRDLLGQRGEQRTVPAKFHDGVGSSHVEIVSNRVSKTQLDTKLYHLGLAYSRLEA